MSTKTLSQPQLALRHANEIRTAQATALRAISAMPTLMGLREVAAVIAEPDAVFAGLRIRRLLLAPTRVGSSKVERWLASADVPHNMKVGRLTDRQRRALIDVVEGRVPVVPTWRARALTAERRVEALRDEVDRLRGRLRELSPGLQLPRAERPPKLPRFLPAGVLCDWVQRHRDEYESADAMAEAWGVAYATVAELLRGKTTRMRFDIADRIVSRHGGYRLEDLWPELEREAA